MLIRKFQTTDYASLRRIVEQDPDVDAHTHYTYWVASSLFPNIFLVAEIDGLVAGYIFGIAPAGDTRRAFLWQVAVSGQHRSKGIARALITQFVRGCQHRQISEIDLTISPDNNASKGLFNSIARSLGTELKMLDTTGDMGGRMKNEDIYRIILLQSK